MASGPPQQVAHPASQIRIRRTQVARTQANLLAGKQGPRKIHDERLFAADGCYQTERSDPGQGFDEPGDETADAGQVLRQERVDVHVEGSAHLVSSEW